MENNVVLYRKYRPRHFSDVRGQDSIIRALRNEIMAGKTGHAYLFSGPRGTGKTTVARIFAKALNCESPVNGEPCGTCDKCIQTEERSNIDVVEIDAASNNGVDNIRQIIDQSQYMPRQGSTKVYIIDEVHMLSSSAFNALLKTLEEPTPSTVFILATTEHHKVPVTILSRCQKLSFNYISDSIIIDQLKYVCSKESIEYEDTSIVYMASLANGSMRDALTILQQVLSYTKWGRVTVDAVKEVFGELEDNTTMALVKSINELDALEAIRIIHEQQLAGKDLSNICFELYNHYKQEYFHNPNIDINIYQRNMKAFAELSEKVKFTENASVLEIELIKLCSPQTEADYNAILQRLTYVENVLELAMHGKIENALKTYKEIDNEPERLQTAESTANTSSGMTRINILLPD